MINIGDSDGGISQGGDKKVLDLISIWDDNLVQAKLEGSDHNRS